MSKNIGIYASIIMVLMCFQSCKKDFLNKLPITDIAPQTFFQNEKDLELYCNGMYTLVPGAGIMTADVQSDNMEIIPYDKVVAGEYLIPSTGGGWDWAYLRRVNYFLENYGRAEASAEAKNHYVGVARLFRAWFYFEKVKRFGNVPWYSGTMNITDEALLYKTQDPRALVMDSVMKDLDFASENVRTSKSPKWTINRYVALSLKSRICLFEGTWRKYRGLADADKFLTAARDAAKKVMDEGGYSLYTTDKPDVDYLNLFAMSDAPVNEVILAYEYSTLLNVKHAFSAESGAYGRGFTKEMVNTYLMKDGTPFTSVPGYATKTYMDEFENRDPRLIQTVLNPLYTRIDRTDESKRFSPIPRIPGGAPTGYIQVKFYQDDAVKSVYGESDNDAPVIRYAEVLLNYAEAMAELGAISQDVLDLTVNKLRDRVGMKGAAHLTMAVAMDPVLAAQYPNVNSALILEIRRERRVELAGEGHRYSDIMRWKAGALFTKKFYGIYFPGLGTYDLTKDGKPDFAIVTAVPDPKVDGVTYAVINKDIFLSNGNSGNIVPFPNQTKTFDENKNYLFPLPTSELLLNTNLVQNPGWIK
ncbi:RagB/SusD family nutrient uptake outer membrane protein [Pedobacter nyackensis]|uniref:RagB/SusD family nutrient uptake outer membrane protein n=1 Tax=Pedobacter nyackensis TaxID=475255 RepID=UPI0029302B8C|nr:RagB/SusD family nutrient uptake outer membrane protein [Pedobacter nyackensis]